jgi:hypothetical protein
LVLGLIAGAVLLGSWTLWKWKGREKDRWKLWRLEGWVGRVKESWKRRWRLVLVDVEDGGETERLLR